LKQNLQIILKNTVYNKCVLNGSRIPSRLAGWMNACVTFTPAVLHGVGVCAKGSARGDQHPKVLKMLDKKLAGMQGALWSQISGSLIQRFYST